MTQAEVQKEITERLKLINDALSEGEVLMKMQERGGAFSMIEDRKKAIVKNWKPIRILEHFILEDTLTIPFVIHKTQLALHD